jgi:hypothetical protein
MSREAEPEWVEWIEGDLTTGEVIEVSRLTTPVTPEQFFAGTHRRIQGLSS